MRHLDDSVKRPFGYDVLRMPHNCCRMRRTHRWAIPFFLFQAEDGIRADLVTGVQTCALPIYVGGRASRLSGQRSRSAPDGDRPVQPGHEGRATFEEAMRLAAVRPWHRLSAARDDRGR